jgi:hypothetical protein
MMSRTQLTLDPELQRRARTRAAELGISLAEYFRRLVARDLESPRRKADPSVVFDLGNSGMSDVARDKDRMIGEAIASRRSTKRKVR